MLGNLLGDPAQAARIGAEPPYALLQWPIS
jgi:hypothetical protein